MFQGRVFQDAPDFWLECDRDGTTAWLVEHAGPLGVLGVSLDIDLSTGVFHYHAAVEAPADLVDLPEGFVRRRIPPCTWGVFRERGPLPLTLQMMIRDVHTTWFTSSNEWAMGGNWNVVRYPDFAQGAPREGDQSIYDCELWMPMRPRQS